MRLSGYWRNIQLDLRLFFFLLLLMELYRVVFMAGMSSFMGPEADIKDILVANFVGLRLSLKSAGGFALLGFLLGTVPALINPKWQTGRARLIVGSMASFLLTVLFIARFPYYKEFHMTYSMQIFQGWHDDKTALLGTMVHEYGLIQGLLAAVLISAVLTWLLHKLLRLPTREVTLPMGRGAAGCLAFIVTFAFMFFCRWGGGVSYATGVNWEHCALAKDDFLNECILDDVQAVYRAINMEERMQQGDIYGVDKAALTQIQAADVAGAIGRQAPGAKIAKPRHIFIILEETGMQWPMMDKYAQLHIADGIKSLAQDEQGYYTSNFMPNGEFTSVAITGMITGIPEINVRVNYQPRSYQGLYPTAMSIPFHELGYKVDFWYGGAPSWDAISRLALAQGFDNFYGFPDLHAPKTTPWGTNDGYLFAALKEHLAQEEPTVHVIMTTSNHPPYNLDLQAENFDVAKAEELVRQLIPEEKDPHNLAVELGHYYYMDKVVTEFARETLAAYPDSLFVITGDHAVRSNPGPQPTIYEFQTVPFVLYGAGVTKDILPEKAVGGCIGITPTLINLIAPEGFKYNSIAPAIGAWPAAFNRSTFLTDKVIGRIEDDKTELLPSVENADMQAERGKLDSFLKEMRTMGYWLVTHRE